MPCPRLRGPRHGSWGFVLDLGAGPDGKRRQVRRGGFATKAAAEQELTRLKRERDAGTWTDSRGITVGSYLSGWLDRKVTAGELRPTTARSAKASRPKVNPWTAAEVSSFLDAVAGERDAALWHLAIFTGLRRGELCGLRWTDLELDAARLVVREAAAQVGHLVLYGPPKTASGDHRVVSLDAVTVAAALAQGRHSG